MMRLFLDVTSLRRVEKLEKPISPSVGQGLDWMVWSCLRQYDASQPQGPSGCGLPEVWQRTTAGSWYSLCRQTTKKQQLHEMTRNSRVPPYSNLDADIFLFQWFHHSAIFKSLPGIPYAETILRQGSSRQRRQTSEGIRRIPRFHSDDWEVMWTWKIP